MGASCCFSARSPRNKENQGHLGSEFVRVVKYRYKTGRDVEVAAVNDEFFAMVETEWPRGLKEMSIATTATTLFGFMVFDAQDDLHAYKANLRTKVLEKMRPLLDGGAQYDFSNSILKGQTSPASRTETSVVRTLSYRFQKSQAEEVSEVLEQVWPLLADERITCWVFYADDAKDQIVIGMLFESQEALATYKKVKRENEKLMAILKSVLDGGPVFEDVAPLREVYRYRRQPTLLTSTAAAKPVFEA